MVETVNELMDEFDRVLVGSVVRGDEILAVDGVRVELLAPAQMEKSLSGAFGTIAELTLRAAAPTSNDSRPIYTIRAKRHVPILVTDFDCINSSPIQLSENWVHQEGENVEKGRGSLSLPRIETGDSDIVGLQHRDSLQPSYVSGAHHLLPTGWSMKQDVGAVGESGAALTCAPFDEIRTRSYGRQTSSDKCDAALPEDTHGQNQSHSKSEPRGPGEGAGEDCAATPREVSTLKISTQRSFTSVVTDDSEEVDEASSDAVSICSISAPTSQAASVRSSVRASPVPGVSGMHVDPGPSSPTARSLESWDEANSPKLEIKRMLYTIIHDAMQRARTTGDIHLHKMINRVEQQVRIFEAAFTKSEAHAELTIKRLQETIQASNSCGQSQPAADHAPPQTRENSSPQNDSNADLRRILEPCLGDGVKTLEGLPEYLQRLKNQVDKLQAERDKALGDASALREQLSAHGPVRTRFEELIMAVRRLAQERDRLLAEHESERMQLQHELLQLRESNMALHGEFAPLHARAVELQQDLSVAVHRESELRKELERMQENESAIHRLHQDDTERLKNRIEALEAMTQSQSGTTPSISRQGEPNLKSIFRSASSSHSCQTTGTPSNPDQHEGGIGVESPGGKEGDALRRQLAVLREENEVLRRSSAELAGLPVKCARSANEPLFNHHEGDDVAHLQEEVAALRIESAGYQKEVKKLKLYMSTMPFPDEMKLTMPRDRNGHNVKE